MTEKYNVVWFQTTAKGSDYLLINVNQVQSTGAIVGCANVAFNGTGDDIPNKKELATAVLEIHGHWTKVPPSNWSKSETSRFVVEAWRTHELPKAALSDVPKPQRSKRLPPAPPTSKRLPTIKTKPARKPQPTKQAIASTNDWYASGGDSLDSIMDMDKSA